MRKTYQVTLTGYVGDDGIEPGVAYKVIDGKFVKVEV